uniref:Uncharacterized protein LOC113789862 n=1 Tax=Dermatophagoides pteronyssinus TaxID=6956 RepID=A0A6P6XR38_DERPT|nr:uncharacterized protein LOC113789862 [Dermatophagoides pteronyssinus]
MIKLLFIIQNLFILTALFGNLLSLIGTLFPINPYRNNFHLFHYSYLRQSNLFTEIRLSNDYFRYYLSYLFIIYLSLFSHLLFVTLNTSSLSTSIFFILVCIYPAVIVLSLCLAVSRLFQKIFNCYKYYQNILAIYQSKILLFQYKLKILSTLDLIEHQTIGFSFIDSTYIQYNTIISIIFITTTLFLQIMNVM